MKIKVGKHKIKIIATFHHDPDAVFDPYTAKVVAYLPKDAEGNLHWKFQDLQTDTLFFEKHLKESWGDEGKRYREAEVEIPGYSLESVRERAKRYISSEIKKLKKVVKENLTTPKPIKKEFNGAKIIVTFHFDPYLYINNYIAALNVYLPKDDEGKLHWKFRNPEVLFFKMPLDENWGFNAERYKRYKENYLEARSSSWISVKEIVREYLSSEIKKLKKVVKENMKRITPTKPIKPIKKDPLTIKKEFYI